MSNKVQAIPAGYHSVTPYMIVKGAALALEFYKKAFGAKELSRSSSPEGEIMHAEIQIGNSIIMLADEYPHMDMRGPQAMNGTPIFIHLYVEDVDSLTAKAVAAGAKVLRPLQDQFYGDRSGSIKDPFGHVWTVSTHKEDVSPEEMDKRLEELMKKEKKSCC